ncbi:hypothetical protein HDV63DRAFT_377500 [Trichoderma sp. SZMC 28014]
MAWHGRARLDRQDPRPAHTYIHARGCRPPLPYYTHQNPPVKGPMAGERRGIAHPEAVQNHAMQGTGHQMAIRVRFTRASDDERPPWWLQCAACCRVGGRGKAKPTSHSVTCSYLWYLLN